MKTVDELLDGVKSRRSIPSDYKLAAYLGVVPGAVKHWRHGRSLPDARVAARIAAELEMDPDVLVAELEAQRAQTAETRELWHRIATRLQGGTVHGVVLAGLVALGFVTTPPNAVAAVTDLQSANSRGSVYYVNKLLALLRAFLRTTRGQVIGKLASPQQHRDSHVSCAWSAAPALAVA